MAEAAHERRQVLSKVRAVAATEPPICKRARLSLSFLSNFSYVCPEPVLVKWPFLVVP
jgi:hypothetical protein